MIKKYKIALIVLAGLMAIEAGLLLWIGLNRPRPTKKAPQVIRGRIAVVLDDWGYSLNNANLLGQINAPLNLSILPNLPFSRKVAELARERGFEVLLHLPMQPRENLRLEQNTILVSMDDAAIAKIVNDDLDDLLYAKGVSNHMGSRATSDPRVMEDVFKELKRRHLYFLDSFVSFSSVCPLIARKIKLKTARRDIFLDNNADPAYIRKQMLKLKKIAALKGAAIGIGHDRKNTLEALKEIIPEMEKEGYRFVFVSELL